MKSLLFDTRVLVDILRGNAGAIAYHDGLIERMGNDPTPTMAVSVVTAHELHRGMRTRESVRTGRLIGSFTVMPVDEDLARLSGPLGRRYAKSHALGLGDILIAATADATAAELVTCNLKHFPLFPDLERPYP